MTLQMDVWTDGRTDGRERGGGGEYNNIPAFSSKSAGITIQANTDSITYNVKMKYKKLYHLCRVDSSLSTVRTTLFLYKRCLVSFESSPCFIR